VIRVFLAHALLSAILTVFLTAYPGETLKVVGAHLLVVGAAQLIVTWLVLLCQPLRQRDLGAARLIPAGIYATVIVLQLFFWGLYAVGIESFGHPFTWWVFWGYVSEYRQLLRVLEYPVWWGDALWLGMALLWVGLAWGLMGRLTLPRHPFWRWGTVGGGTAIGLMLFAGFPTAILNAVSHYQEPTYAVFFSHPSNAYDRVNRKVEPDFEVWETYPRDLLQHPPHVVVIVVDALRADYLPMYDREKGRFTPFLDSLYQQPGWTRVDTAFSSAAASFGGISSLMSGRTLSHLTEHSFTLADALHHQGYETHFYLSGNHTTFFNLNLYYGRETMFSKYVDASLVSEFTVNDDRIVTFELQQLPNASNTPLYLHLHLNSVHESGWLKEPYRSVDVGDVNPYAAHYHRGLMQLDENLRTIWRTLRSKGYLEHAVVAITADHGQLLGEQGKYGHGNSLNAEQTWIPMLFWSSDRGMEVNRTYASTIDFAPTLLHHLKLPQPAKWIGIPLQQPETAPRYTFHRARRTYSVVARTPDGWYKYDRNEQVLPIREELFDLHRDFRQQQPLSWNDSAGPDGTIVPKEKRRKILEDLRRQCTHYYTLTEIPERSPQPSAAGIR